MTIVRRFQHRFIKCFLNLFRSDIFHDCIRNHRSGIVPDHTSPMSRRSPFRQESTLLIGIQQSFLYLGIHRRIRQIQQRKKTTESIPKTGIGKHIPRQYFTIVGTIMNRLATGIELAETTREKHRTVKARIKGTHFVEIHFYVEYTQSFIPYFPAFFFYLVERLTFQFFQITFSLFKTDKRRSDTGLNFLSALGFETDQCANMLILQFFTITHFTVFPNRPGIRCFLQHNNKIILKVFRNSPAITGRVTDDFVFLRNNLNIRSPVVRIDHNISFVGFRKSKTEISCPIGRSNLSDNIMLGQVYAIIIRFSHFCFVGEPAGTFFFIDFHPFHRHDGKHPVVIDPRTGLVGLLKPPQPIVIIYIGPSVTHFSSLRHPEVHSPGAGNGRIGVTGRQLMFGQRPH